MTDAAGRAPAAAPAGQELAAERSAAAGGGLDAARRLQGAGLRRLALERPGRGSLAYRWDFGDGVRCRGCERRPPLRPEPGTYNALLRVVDGSGQVGERCCPAVARHRQAPARGRGGRRRRGRRPASRSASTAPARRPATGRSRAMPGTSRTAARRPAARKPGHAFAHAGPLPGHARGCRTTSPVPATGRPTQVTVDVNARAGRGRRARTGASRSGEAVELDGGRSYDPDGGITAWSWDLGDGIVGRGADRHAPLRAARHLHGDAHGARRCRGRQQHGREPRPGSSSTIRRWRSPDRTGQVAVGEIIAFDGSGSVDRDGKLVRHAWDFGDGR